MTTRAVVLLSGGLDSILAIRILQEQGVEVEAVNFQTIFTCCRDNAARAAHDLNVRLTVLEQGDDYVELVRRPRYGYGKGANPCVDCRIYMFRHARTFMHEIGATFVASGEVLGQRPMSQKRRDLDIIARQSGLDSLLLRPLSALLLPPTHPETTGQVDRSRLYAFAGRSRKGLIRLAKHFGLKDIPSPSTGCALTEKTFAGKVHDLIRIDSHSQRWDFELLNVGRHLRIDTRTKAIVGRNASENESLDTMFRAPQSRGSALFVPDNFAGPTVMLVGPPTESALQFAGALLLRYTKRYDPENAVVIRDLIVDGDQEGISQSVRVHPLPQAAELSTL